MRSRAAVDGLWDTDGTVWSRRVNNRMDNRTLSAYLRIEDETKRQQTKVRYASRLRAKDSPEAANHAHCRPFHKNMAVPPAGRHTYKTYHQKLEEYRLGDPGAKLRSNAELNMVSAQNPSNSSSILEKNSDADYHRPRQLGKDAAQSVEKRSNKLISHWEKKADEHQKKQLTNPFSGYGGDTYIPKYNKNSENYGRPAEGSQTAQRGKRAAKHISFEIFELCLIIARRGKKQPDGSIVITFGALFEIYINISNKVVGMLMRARRQKLLTFETEMLYQGRDEGVLITLFKIPKEEEILV